MKSGKNDTVLLKIKREFEESEAVRFLSAELSKAKFKIGELMSEISELKHIVKLQKEEAARLNDCLHQKIKIHPDHSSEVKRLNKLLSEKGTVIKRLTDEIDLLLSRSVVQKNSSLPPQTSSPAGEGAVLVEEKGCRTCRRGEFLPVPGICDICFASSFWEPKPLPESKAKEPSRGIVAEDSTDALMEQLRKSEIN